MAGVSSEERGSEEECERESGVVPPPPVKKSKLDSPLVNYETDETKNLSNGQLQRLVMLEQLQLLRLKKERITNLNLIPTTPSYVLHEPEPNEFTNMDFQ